MKKLLVVRHAKSDWSQPGQTDEKRNINDKGILKSGRIIDYLKRKEILPDLIITSHALRACETAQLIAKGIGIDPEDIQIHPKIYSWNEDQLFDLFLEIPDNVETLMIVGHNPVLTNFINYLVSPPIDWMPTSSVAALSVPIKKWSEISKNKAELLFFITPKMLK